MEQPMTADQKTRARINRAFREKALSVKVCNTCYAVKAATQFNTDNRAYDRRRKTCVSCSRAGSREWNSRNPRDRSDYRRSYYQENADRIRARQRAYYQANAEDRKAANRRYYAENKDRLNEIAREYHAANRGERHARHRSWLAANPGYYRDYYETNRTKNKDFEPCVVRVRRCSACGGLKSEWDFALALGRACGLQGRCRECAGDRSYRKACRRTHGDPENTTCYLCCQPNDEDAWADHLIPQSKGGSHDGFNVRWVHADCNMSRQDADLTPEQLRVLFPDREPAEARAWLEAQHA